MTHQVNLPVLTTARLRLVPATAADTDALCALLWQPEVRRYLCDDVVFPREQVAGSLQSSVAHWPAGLGHWSIRNGQGKYVGFVELKPVSADIVAAAPHLAGEIEPMIAIAPPAWRSGYAAEALGAAIDHAFSTVGLARLAALVDEPNASSHRLMARAGFVAAGHCAGARFPLRIYRLTRSSSAAPASARPSGAGC
jgi:ribosomal-protein-alanine N-acetyltransferase